MRITNNNSPQFGKYIATDKAIKYLNQKLNPEQMKKANEIFKSHYAKSPDVNLCLGSFRKYNSDTKIYYLRATVNDVTFKEGLSRDTFDVIKDSAKYVDSLNKPQEKRSLFKSLFGFLK